MIDFSYVKTDYSKRLEDIRQAHMIEHMDRQAEVAEAIPEVEELQKQISASSVALIRKQVGATLSPEEKKAQRQALSLENKKLQDKISQLLQANGFAADYLDMQYDCPLCKDTGSYKNGTCSCVHKMQVADLYKSSNLESILKSENFDNFDLSLFSQEDFSTKNKAGKTVNYVSPAENMRKVLAESKDFCNTFDCTTGKKSLLFYGETGHGKTFLTHCIAKSLLDTGHTVLYLTASEMMDQVIAPYLMRREETGPGLKTAYELLYKSDLLVIDDLGTETLNNFSRTQIFEVINRRLIDNAATIISTNLDPSGLTERYSERIMSRIVQDYALYYLYGKDNLRYKIVLKK